MLQKHRTLEITQQHLRLPQGRCLFSVVATGGLLVPQRMTSYLCTLEKDPPWFSSKPLYKLGLMLFYVCK